MIQVMDTTLSATGAEGQPLLCNGAASGASSGVGGSSGLHHSWPDHHPGGVDEYRNRHDKNGSLLACDTVINIGTAASPVERSGEPRLLQEKWKTLVAFTFLSANLILNLTCLAIVHERIPDRTKYPPLPDIFFDFFPPLDWALDVSESIIIFCIWTTLGLLLIHRYREYSPQRCKYLHLVYLVLSTVGIFMVLLSRGHYTVDVVIGYYVTSRVFWIYHTLANNMSLKVASQNNYLSRSWWFPLFSYFEKNVGGVVPRQYEWPLPWPRRWLPRTRIS